MAQKRTFAVIGLGSFGSTIALELARFGDHVLGIDINERQVTPCLGQVNEAIIADGTDINALKEAGVASYDVVIVAIGENLEASLLCLMNLRELGINEVYVKALDKQHQRIVEALGAHEIILPEQEVGEQIAQRLHNPRIRDYIQLAKDQYLADIALPTDFKSKPLSAIELENRFGLRCLAVVRDREILAVCDGDIGLFTGDRLIITGERSAMRAFSDRL